MRITSSHYIQTPDMEPSVKNIFEENGTLQFQLTNTNVSFANAIRRTILSDIPTLVFRAAPYDSATINISKNTSRLNNEIIRHRLSCVPIHHDIDFPTDKYVFKIEMENTGDSVITVTTGDIKVFDTDTGKEEKQASKTLFPPDPVTGDYIQLVRLNPKVSEQLPGESLMLEATATVATAAEDGAFNVACVDSYAYTVDKEKQAIALEKHLKELKAEYTQQNMDKDSMTEALNYAKNGWLALDGKRITVPNSFDFVIESVGVFKNEELVRRSCDVIINKLDSLQSILKNVSSLADLFDVTSGEFVMVKLENYDYTIAKILEAVLYHRNWNSKSKLDGIDYVATLRPHPHIPEIYLRLHYSSQLPENLSLEEHSRAVVDNAAQLCKDIFNKIKTQFPK